MSSYLNFNENSKLYNFKIYETFLSKKKILKLEKYFNRMNLYFNKFLLKKKPFIFKMFNYEYLNKKFITQGFFNIFYKKILKISHRGIFLLEKSQIFNKNSQKTIQGF
jgi:hypothetical protein